MAISNPKIKNAYTFSLVDLILFLGVVCFIYALVGVAKDWSSPYHPKIEIELGFTNLLWYSFFSLIRVTAAYFLSLIFTFTYGYVAAKSRIAEPVLISLLDILQSIPVLGFMPGLILALVHIFPNSNLGLELAAVIMIFTGEGWNMVFSFYSSVKAVPIELKEMAATLRLKKYDLFRMVEVPYATNGLLWNSMLSMAGGWFFLMTIESQTLGNQDFRLRGIGAYMTVAYERQDVTAIIMGLSAMFFLIFIVDRCVWAPLVVWSEKFKFEQDNNQIGQRSLMLDLIRKSTLLEKYFELKEEIRKILIQRLEKKRKSKKKKVLLNDKKKSLLFKVARMVFLVLGVLFFLLSFEKMSELLGATHLMQWLGFIRDVFYTFLRVTFAVVIGSLWTIPAGVFIGTNPKWTRRLQPVIQIVASFPAPMLFPIIVYLMNLFGISFTFSSLVLMIFACQWYVLFNVVSGATFIPKYMMELSASFRLSRKEKWKAIIIPAIFPSLVNGWITAAGGAWNASIVAEIVNIGKDVYVTSGIGATIMQSANRGDYPSLAGSILVMVTVVVLLNRFFWGYLYKLAETRFRMEM